MLLRSDNSTNKANHVLKDHVESRKMDEISKYIGEDDGYYEIETQERCRRGSGIASS
jgi:hypothetical protein